MQRDEASKSKESHAARFVPVFDSRKSKISDRSGNRQYGQMRIDTPDGKTRPVRVALEATKLDDAKRKRRKSAPRNARVKCIFQGIALV